MTWRPHPLPPVPEATAAVVKAVFPKGNLYVDLRTEFGTLYDDHLFADVYSRRWSRTDGPQRSRHRYASRPLGNHAAANIAGSAYGALATTLGGRPTIDRRMLAIQQQPVEQPLRGEHARCLEAVEL